MHDLCALRVLGVNCFEQAIELAEKASVELGSDYSSADFGVDVIRSMKACDFLSIYLGIKINREEALEWISKNDLHEIYDNFCEERMSDEIKFEQMGELFGEDFSSCFYINKIDLETKTVDGESDLYFNIHFDICPVNSYWDYVGFIYPSNKKKTIMGIDLTKLEFGKTTTLSSNSLHRGFAHVLVLDAKKERDEYKRLLPIYNKQFFNKFKYTTLSDSFDSIPLQENDYVLYLYPSY